MLKMKNLLGCLLVFVMVAAPLTSVGAAAPAQTGTVDGTVQSCMTDDSTGETTVVCEINLDGGGTRTIRLSVADAVFYELAVEKEDGTVTIIAEVGQKVQIDEALLLEEEDPCVLPENASQPISKLLANYFCKDLGATYDDIQTLHEDGFGFGEIAQACFMALKLDNATCEDVLMAKRDKNFESLNLPEGVSVTNWGQLKKIVFNMEPKGSKNSNNPGSVVSDNAKNDNTNDKEKSNNGKSDEDHGKPNK